ncbi:type IV pilin N-terminal domain-containing protein [Methanoculleus sp.]|uniref:type IV pilin N-terminal domain-containing protein n=1 Tax=Methanoculleus sp. TaxID=90427 RepID=UPI00260B7085|nr:type IV pilin N-terminal domain-containing protein [Methanoculleus sp.]MDI6867654.1 type IV pilin N-terminal domain-containing protein [Methanoculleus sp.]
MRAMKGTGRRAVQAVTGHKVRSDEHAVSEIVGIALLLAVVVMGVGIVAVTIYSQPMPEKTPQVEILISASNSFVNLTHNGGDPLEEGSFYVLADGTRLADPPTLSGGSWPWSIGEVLQYSVDSAPGQVLVVYDGGGGAVLLKSATISGAAGTAGPDLPARPGGGGGNYTSPTFNTEEELNAWVVDQFVGQLKNNSIYLAQDLKSDNDVWGSMGFFNFTLSDNNTYLEIAQNQNDNPNRYNFTAGDRMGIHLDNSVIRFFAIGHEGWHISASGVTVYKNGQKLTNTTGNKKDYIKGGRIYRYSSFNSSVIITTKGGLQTELYINNTPIISGTWNKQITLTNIKPAEPTLMILDISKNDPNYFLGMVDSIAGYT